MPDEPLESTLEAQETLEPPVPAVPSVPSGVEPTSAASGIDVEALEKRLLERVESRLVETVPQLVERGIQSTKDRRFQVLGDIDPDLLQSFKQYLDQFDGDFNKAVREMQVDRLLAGASPQRPGTAGGGASGLQTAMTAVSTEILNGADIPFDDPEYHALAKAYGGKITSAEDWRAVVQAFADKRTSKQAKREGVGPAAAANEGGGGAASGLSDDPEEIAVELMALQSGRRGSLTDPKVIERRKVLKDRQRELMKAQGLAQ